MIRGFLLWWAEQLAPLLPLFLRQRQGGWANALVGVVADFPVLPAAAPDARLAMEFRVRSNRRESTLGRFGIDATQLAELRRRLDPQIGAARLILRLPPAALLERRVALPLAAERAPQQVLHHEMDRLTPFAAHEVFWTWSAERRDVANGQWHVLLSLVPKSGLQALIAALAQAGMPPAALEVSLLGAAAPRVFNLLLARSAPEWRQRHGLLAAAIGCAVLAVLALATPFFVQSAALRAIDRRISALQPQVTQAMALRQRLAGEASGIGAIAAQRAESGDVLAVLASVTDILPDDTYLNLLKLRHRGLEIHGQSVAAPRLIAALAADPLIRNPVFAAPVTRTGVGRTDLFTIRAEIAP